MKRVVQFMKRVVFNEADPAIGITLERIAPSGGPTYGWYGECTQCGHPVFRWDETKAVDGAQRHVDLHESGL